MWMKHCDVSFDGIVLKGMLHLTSPAKHLTIVQRTYSGCVPIDTFPEIDPTISDGQRWYKTYEGFMKRGVVFIRNVDGAISVIVSTRIKFLRVRESTREAMYREDISSVQLEEILRGMEMPVGNSCIYDGASKSLSLVLCRISKRIALKTTFNTFGKVPLAFRVDKLDVFMTRKEGWALLVPRTWLNGNIFCNKVSKSVPVFITDTRSVRKLVMNTDFEHTVRAIEDNLLNSDLVAICKEMPTPQHVAPLDRLTLHNVEAPPHKSGTLLKGAV
jgi:hypothetical protein